MSNTNTTVGVFHSRPKADEAIRKRQKPGFEMQKYAVVGKDWRHAPPTQGDRARLL